MTGDETSTPDHGSADVAAHARHVENVSARFLHGSCARQKGRQTEGNHDPLSACNSEAEISTAAFSIGRPPLISLELF
jgi:hypothetical protein